MRVGGRIAFHVVATGEKVPCSGVVGDACWVSCAEGSNVIDLDHWRRAQRLLPILLDRFGPSFFMTRRKGGRTALHRERIERTAALAADWIGRRSGRTVDVVGEAELARMIVELVQDALASMPERAPLPPRR
jgi:hypothetical protein